MPQQGNFQAGQFIMANPAADTNVELGWIPDYVQVVNVDNSTITAYHAHLHSRWLAFDSGGTTEIVPDMHLNSAGDGSGYVKQVVVTSGTWAGGDAAGWIEFQERDFVPGWDNNDEITTDEAVNVATAAGDSDNVVSVAAAAAVGELVWQYNGSAGSAAKGFTVDSTIAAAGERVLWAAWAAG